MLSPSRRLYLCYSIVFNLLCLLSPAGFPPLLFAQNDFGGFLEGSKPAQDTDIKPEHVIQWEGVQTQQQPDGRYQVGLRLQTRDGFTLYTDKVKFLPPAGFLVDGIETPPTKDIVDPMTGEQAKVYTAGEFLLTLSSKTPPVGNTFSLSITFVACTEKICLFPHTTQITMPYFARAQTPASGPQPKGSDVVGEPDTSGQPTSIDAPPPEPASDNFEFNLAKSFEKDDISPLALMAILFLGGLLTNLTPCVYPMIPITLRILGKYGRSTKAGSLAYASGILVSYTCLGLAAAAGGGMFGSLLANPYFNLAFGLIMAVFGITMLGFGNFLFLQNLGTKLGTGKPSLKNVFLMGTGAGLVASPCTGPILAALLAYTSRTGDYLLSAGMLFIYSFGFALPYVALGGAAAKVSAIRVPPMLQNLTKIAFAGVMFALSMYYLRIPAYRALEPLKPYWSLTAWVCLGFGVLFAAVILNYDREMKHKIVTLIPALLIGIGTFSLSQARSTATPSQLSVKWYKSEAEAFSASLAQNRPILVDAWAEWCEACKKMDVTTFVDPAVVKEIHDKWIPLKLDLTANSDEDIKIQEKYGLLSLPTLTMLKPGGHLETKVNIAGYVTGPELLKRLRSFQGE